MTQEEVGIWVQVVAVVIAIGASVTALCIAHFDRRNAREIAEEDRRVALRQSQLLFEQSALLRLAQILDRAGHTDPQISKDMGAESQALIGAIGRGRLPVSWDLRIKRSRDGLLDFVDDVTNESWQRRAVEAHIALMDVAQEIEGLTAESKKSRPHRRIGRRAG